MKRREFLKLSAGVIAGAAMGPRIAVAQTTYASATSAYDVVEAYFLKILVGFLKNAAATSRDYAVCDFPEGTKLGSCCTPSGKTYVSVARMLPAMAEWSCVNPGRTVEVEGERVELAKVLLSIYRTAFDPKHPDFWGLAPAGKPTQRSVEACLVAWGLWRMGDEFIGKLSAQERGNIQAWLASCTQVPERTNNHAWFTAINQAARLQLSGKWKEFAGDEQWMLEDLKALDGLYKPDNDGWYSDSPDAPVYDYYNFYVFPNFSLYWSQIIGARYPEWNEKVRARVKEFLVKTPYFFDSDGGYPLYGRSLIYRWTLLSPLVSGYREKLWPHGPGLLRRIVLKNLEWHWNLGAFDEKLGKLRETFSAEGSAGIRENYLDNGHPYWPMTAFFVLGVAKDDPLWNAAEEALPVEKGDFVTRFEGPRMMLVGTKRTGEVKLALARPATRRDYYRDKYMKFVYSSHFPCNVGQPKGEIPCDQMLVFKDEKGEAGRVSVESGELIADGVKTVWSARLSDLTLKVITRVRFIGEFEERTHEVEVEGDLGGRKISVCEGSYPVLLGSEDSAGEGEYAFVQSARGGMIAVWRIAGYRSFKTGNEFGGENLIYPRTGGVRLETMLENPKMTLASLHYASRKPVAKDEMIARANEIISKRSR